MDRGLPEALASTDPAGVIAEVRELVFQQLIEHSVPAALRFRDLTADATWFRHGESC